MKLFSILQRVVDELNHSSISNSRKEELQELINYVKSKNGETASLNFVCTHNSRRSQFSQIWGQIAADYFGISANCYSGGVEVTAFNERAVSSLKRFGLIIDVNGKVNPNYSVKYSDQASEIIAFSKLVEDKSSAHSDFAAIITCSHADENCPFIPGAEKRIPIRYDDPKEFDDTPLEEQKYDERSLQIANEMFYVFSKVKD